MNVHLVGEVPHFPSLTPQFGILDRWLVAIARFFPPPNGGRGKMPHLSIASALRSEHLFAILTAILSLQGALSFEKTLSDIKTLYR